MEADLLELCPIAQHAQMLSFHNFCSKARFCVSPLIKISQSVGAV